METQKIIETVKKDKTLNSFSYLLSVSEDHFIESYPNWNRITAKERKDIRNSLIDELASIILGNSTKSIRDMGIMDKYFNLHQAVTIVPLIENQSSKASKND